jgi:predicted metal-dependent peptidase
MTNKTKSFDLNMHTARLLMDEPFFASLSRRVNKTSSTAIPTAGVRVNPDTAQFEMIYNPKFFATLDDAARKDVLKHEFYHLVFEHVTSRKPEDVTPRVWNFATDLAINSHLDHLPKGCLKPGLMGSPFEDFPSGLSAEAYLKLLQKKQEESQANAQGKDKSEGEEDESGDKSPQASDGLPEEGQFDSHDDWGATDSVTEEIAKERLKDFIKKAAEDANKSSNGWGSVPSSCRRDILERLKTHVDWKKVLRYFIKTSTRASRTSTVKRLNKRYRYIHPGSKVRRQAKIAISIDQSGSVDDEMLTAFFSELSKLAKLASFTVIPFDTRVEESLVYEWKQGQNHKTERVMSGGTCFDAPTAYVNQHGFDGHIVLTDLMAQKPKASKCQRMWMTTKYHASRPYFKTNERILAIDT